MAGSRGGCAGRVTRDAEKRKLSKALQEARGEPGKHLGRGVPGERTERPPELLEQSEECGESEKEMEVRRRKQGMLGRTWTHWEDSGSNSEQRRLTV